MATVVRTAVLVLFLLPIADTSRGAVITGIYRLGAATISGTVASLQVELEFTTDLPSDGVVFFGIDVLPSDALLSVGGTDFSAFSFTPASSLLDDWTLLRDFDASALPSLVEYDTLLAPLAAGTYVLGTLAVDFGSSGAAAGDSLTVAINGPLSAIGAELAGNPPSFEFFEVSFEPGSLQFQVPGGDNGGGNGGGGSTVPAPASVLIWSVLSLIGTGVSQWRRTSASG